MSFRVVGFCLVIYYYLYELCLVWLKEILILTSFSIGTFHSSCANLNCLCGVVLVHVVVEIFMINVL